MKVEHVDVVAIYADVPTPLVASCGKKAKRMGAENNWSRLRARCADDADWKHRSS